MLHSSIFQMPSLDVIQNATDEAKLKINIIEKYFIKDDLKDCFLYVGKNNPDRYFDQQIRDGISFLFIISKHDEVEQGFGKT
jgi:hypothetical protein